MATRSRYLLQMAFKGIRARAVCHQSSTLTSNQGRLQWKRQLRPLSCSHTLYTSDSPSTGSCYTFIMTYSSTSLHEAQAQSVTVVLQLHNLYWKSPGWNLDGGQCRNCCPIENTRQLAIIVVFFQATEVCHSEVTPVENWDQTTWERESPCVAGSNTSGDCHCPVWWS